MIDIEAIGVPAFAIRVTEEGDLLYAAVNALNTERTGVTNEMVAGKTCFEVFGSDAAERLIPVYQECAAQRRLVEYEVSADFPKGWSWWRATMMPVVGESGRVETLLGLCHIPNERAQPAAESAPPEHRYFDLALRSLKSADWRYDTRTGRHEVSPNLALLLGEQHPRSVSWDEWTGRILMDDLARTSCDDLLTGDISNAVVRFRYVDIHGDVRWAQCRRSSVLADGRVDMIYGLIVDITEERRREIELEQKAYRDSLTGLLNRRGFQDTLHEARTETGTFTLYMLDLDGFKHINDTMGHQAGDDILVEVARRLERALGERSTIARLGGDEFIACVAGISDIEAAALECKLRDQVDRPFWRGREIVPVRASVGMAHRARDISLPAMMAEADERLYRDKMERKRRERPRMDGATDGAGVDPSGKKATGRGATIHLIGSGRGRAAS